MKDEMSELESKINIEITKRIEMNKSIKTVFFNLFFIIRNYLMNWIHLEIYYLMKSKN